MEYASCKPSHTLGKSYRLAEKKDLEFFKDAEKHLEKKRKELFDKWGTDPVPDEIISTPDGKEYAPGGVLYNFTPVVLYGMTKWGDLFNFRQKLTLITFVEKVRQAHEKMLEEGYEQEYARAVVSYLAKGVDMTAAFTNMLARWENTSEAIKQLYSRQALPMLWDYAEVNPFSGSSGSLETGWEYYAKVIGHCIQVNTPPATVKQASAISLPYPDDYFDAVITDPPYYDNVPYSDLSDFFYVWLKRAIGDLYPELFATPLTPKTEEIIDSLCLLRGMPKGKAYEFDDIKVKRKEDFEAMLAKAFKEIERTLKPEGIASLE
ncbi:MAG: hypothetical protein AB1487_10245 [Thermodesulfobacteriota bacterium]